MSLSTLLRPRFNSKDRSRGASYYRRDAVYSMEIDKGMLVAEVEGSYCNYEVTLDISDADNGELISCTCPRFQKGDYCKHIWATILKYESEHKSTAFESLKIPSRAHEKKRLQKNKQRQVPQWQSLLDQVSAKRPQFASISKSPFQSVAARHAEVRYVIDVSDRESFGPNKIQIGVFRRERKTNGEWGKLTPLNLSHDTYRELSEASDQKISTLLMGADRKYSDLYNRRNVITSFCKFEVNASWPNELCNLLVNSGRLHWTLGLAAPEEDFTPLEFFDLDSPVEICIEITEQANPKDSSLLEVFIESNGQRIDNNEVVNIADDGIVVLRNGIAKISNPEAIEFWTRSRNTPHVTILKKERADFLKQLSEISDLPKFNIPDAWKVQQPTSEIEPTGILKLHDDDQRDSAFSGEVIFAYEDTEFPLAEPNSVLYDANENCWSVRKPESESKLLQQLASLPIEDTHQTLYAVHDVRIYKRHLAQIVDQLANDGWKIVLLGKPVKQAGAFDISVESGQDWFDLSAKVSFDGETIPLPGLLAAISKKEHFVTLADGSRGRIPAEMVEKYARLAKFGQVEDDKIRFRPSQAMLLDAMLDAKEVSFDKGFNAIRKKLQSLNGVKPKPAPRGFQGELRTYQSEGLGWLHFLREFRLGGCLADDMGLGKTIQVLSLLESRRTRRGVASKSDSNAGGKTKATVKTLKASKASKSKTRSLPERIVAAELRRKPSIVVVPKSLIFNWIEEAAKFTPRLRIVNYTGTARIDSIKESLADGGFDVLLTTYGTLRKDIADLSQIEFDYAILDESQAIKNSKAQCSKSSRLLIADHRLAMTGTPIENHLGELWSLFEFLNPGMLGGSTNFAKLISQKKSNEEEREATLAALAKAIQPFMLRRTKEQVLTDLPPKTEQTLYCDMLPSQKKAYNELKEYYRVKLARKVETDGIGRSKIQVLEALLRLRQVACDPRLVDKDAKPGAKLELLGDQITKIASEGHKVLVFSQFTSFLALVKEQFDAESICYEYLDGKSSNRAASVKRFQEDDSVSAFLISIKAGGHGLNLTAADYVFLLDPWWNPAVEAQAIDRAHRMGQQNPVIAYRMICRDTVEEKIVSLQQSKRDLADAIVRSDESLIRSMTAEDLQILFQ